MFIVSVKPKKKTVIIVSAIVAAVILLIIGITVLSTAGRIEFLEQFGWKTSGKATKTEKITIPSEFNEVYTSYNELQKQQGLDLTKYSGEECTKYTYKILNFDSNSKIVANLLVLDKKVIGGDISETKKDGFMQTFYKNK